MALTRDTEIRKLTSNDLFPLYNILKPERSWTKLMKLIPKVLEPNGVVETNSLPKYSATDINSVKDAGEKAENGAFEVLVDEWGTSGKIRPTIGHLLNLLNKAQLLSAVAYIYETLLNEPAPQPPSTGPARHIEIPSGVETTEINGIIEDLTYPGSSAIVGAAVVCQNLDVNKDFYNKVGCDKLHKVKFDDGTRETQLPSNDGRNRTQSNSQNESITRDAQPNHNNNNNQSTESRNNPNDIEGDNNNNNMSPILPTVSTTSFGNSTDLPILSLLNQPVHADNVMNENNSNSLNENMVSDGSSEQGANSNRISSNSSNSSSSTSDSRNNTTTAQSLSNVSSYSNQLPNIEGLLQSDDTSNLETNELNIPALSMLQLNDNIPIIVAEINSTPPIDITSDQSNEIMTNGLMPALSTLLSLPTLNNNLIEFDYFQLQTSTDNFNNNSWLANNLNSGRLIGSGGFSIVYLGLNLHENIQQAAVKRIVKNQENIKNGYKYEEKFQMEIDILSQNSHINLVKLLGYSKNGPENCLIYEFIKDGNLQNKLTRCRENSDSLNWISRLKIAYGIADAISYLHSVNIIHRDIKSANILLDGDIAKLCDFGFLRSIQSNELSGLWGTSSYVAPEYFHGDNNTPGLDVYSFGVVLLELVSGTSVTDRNQNIENLIIYVQANINNPLLINIIDRKAGLWKYENTITDQNVTSGHYLLDLAIKCLERKETRPNIIQIKNNLQKTIEFFCKLN